MGSAAERRSLRSVHRPTSASSTPGPPSPSSDSARSASSYTAGRRPPEGAGIEHGHSPSRSPSSRHVGAPTLGAVWPPTREPRPGRPLYFRHATGETHTLAEALRVVTGQFGLLPNGSAGPGHGARRPARVPHSRPLAGAPAAISPWPSSCCGVAASRSPRPGRHPRGGHGSRGALRGEDRRPRLRLPRPLDVGAGHAGMLVVAGQRGGCWPTWGPGAGSAGCIGRPGGAGRPRGGERSSAQLTSACPRSASPTCWRATAGRGGRAPGGRRRLGGHPGVLLPEPGLCPRPLVALEERGGNVKADRGDERSIGYHGLFRDGRVGTFLTVATDDGIIAAARQPRLERVAYWGLPREDLERRTEELEPLAPPPGTRGRSIACASRRAWSGCCRPESAVACSPPPVAAEVGATRQILSPRRS